MTHASQRSPTQITVSLLMLLLLAAPLRVLAHAGHGNEFQGGSHAAQSVDAVQVDAETAKRLGLKVEAVSRQRLAFGIKTTGQIESLPNQQVEVTTPVKGTVTQLLVQPGDRVRAGQAVAIMTSPELAELRTTALDRRSEAIGSTQQAQADLRLAQQNVAQQQKIAATDIAQARTQLSFAQERFDKDQVLAASGALPRRTFLESETKLAEAKAALTKATSRLEVSEAAAQLQRAEAAVQVARSQVQLSAETYQARLRQLGARANQDGTITIAAPISGTVADRETTAGESGEDAGKKVMTIINGSSVQVSANVYEKDLDRIQTGQRVQLKVASLPKRMFQGQISVIGSTVQGETRVVPVKAQLDNPDGVLKPGMFAELEVLTDRTPVARLAIPKSALVTTNDQKTIVFVQNGTTFQPTEVTLGRDAGEFVEVKNGLFDGDRIVTQRANQLYAQSLRGGKPTEDHGETIAAPVSNPQASIPWWIGVPLGGAMMAGTFAAGMVWANRRHRKAFVSPSNGHNQHESVDDFSLTDDAGKPTPALKSAIEESLPAASENQESARRR
ncbi:efflux RND transporter periplasmic adaptor subunit [Leptolyngbya sp. FACHB-321]|uniref:efflux RND transporter periplasmic adaptor subunit n=1 Tax=Leptolyngbya sp. FACHB-321 TaxID=2692807 RepID=UPI00168870E3|nr:efflux RND transporter periplasmic adaptor subunit [Leptolyngbya sp. FACHB-321]MBD2035635.1 efflux RND transporter periplasmic adaptor subunit [Leptolyngbya sp. FACHB-321]